MPRSYDPVHPSRDLMLRFIHTDDYRIYDHLDGMGGFSHTTTNHSKGQYKKSYVHSNTVEGLFSDLRICLSRYKGVCKRYLYRFVSLFQFNYNNRWLNPMDRFIGLLSTLIGR